MAGERQLAPLRQNQSRETGRNLTRFGASALATIALGSLALVATKTAGDNDREAMRQRDAAVAQLKTLDAEYNATSIDTEKQAIIDQILPVAKAAHKAQKRFSADGTGTLEDSVATFGSMFLGMAAIGMGGLTFDESAKLRKSRRNKTTKR